jgi:DNA invertase Pin-like site-specific DNA recombinase
MVRRTRQAVQAEDFAISYDRFSHPDQAKGDSLRRQGKLRDDWLRRTKVRLDTSLRLQDKGVSGYTGEHRENPDRHALASLLRLVKEGQVPRGTYLIVEALDRLSREDIIPALSLFLELLQAGIRIVQLIPVEVVYDIETANPMQVMMAIMELNRGHSESAVKSERVGAAWQEKKRLAAAGGVPVTKRSPCWLRVVGGKWEVIEAGAAAVRRVFRLAIDGYGIGVITKKLNAEGLSPIGRGKSASEYWARSYVAKILSNPAVIGHYQPYTGRGRKRRPDGEPIPGYYPAVVSEAEWHAARGALVARRGKAGRSPKNHVNVFTGLLHDARNGGTIQQAHKGKRGGRILASYRAVQGAEGARFASFPFEVFEREVLARLREIKPADVLPKKDRGADRLLALSGRLAELEGEIEKVKARLQSRYSDAVADVLERHERDRKELAAQLAAARQEAASPLGEAWGQCRSLLDVLDNAPDPEEARVRLRSALRRITEGIWCLFVGRGAWRIAAVQLWFTGGAHRDYIIFHRPATGGAVGERPAQTACESLARVAPGKLDLRKPEDARELEAALLALDLEGVAE